MHHRVDTIVSEDDDKEEERKRLNQTLRFNGYDKWAIKTATKKNKKSPREASANISSRSKGSVTIPYIKGVSEPMRCILRKRGVTVHFRPINTIQGVLVGLFHQASTEGHKIDLEGVQILELDTNWFHNAPVNVNPWTL